MSSAMESWNMGERGLTYSALHPYSGVTRYIEKYIKTCGGTRVALDSNQGHVAGPIIVTRIWHRRRSEYKSVHSALPRPGLGVECVEGAVRPSG